MISGNAGRGQYDIEYRECPCFWGHEPAKYVRRLTEWLSPDYATALDLGAGEGKNAFYLRQLGLSVHAVEVSRYAVRNFVERLIADEVDDVTLTLGDARQVPDGQQYDVVVAYGLLHCLSSKEEIARLIARMQMVTKPGGLHIVSAFTDRIGVPTEQAYLSPTLLAEGEVLKWYGARWEVLAYENDTLVESHPTSQSEHRHSLFRLAIRRL